MGPNRNGFRVEVVLMRVRLVHRAGLNLALDYIITELSIK